MVYFLIILWYISSSPPLQCATTFCFHSAGWVEASPAWQQGAITHRAADPTEPRHFQAPELHNTTSLRQQMGAKIPCPTTSPTSRQCSPPPPIHTLLFAGCSVPAATNAAPWFLCFLCSSLLRMRGMPRQLAHMGPKHPVWVKGKLKGFGKRQRSPALGFIFTSKHPMLCHDLAHITPVQCPTSSLYKNKSLPSQFCNNSEAWLPGEYDKGISFAITHFLLS